MSQPQTPSRWRAALLYTAFDLKQTNWGTYLFGLLFPLVVLLPVLFGASFLRAPTELLLEPIVVVSPDAALRAEFPAFADLAGPIEMLADLPSDTEQRLEDGSIIVVLESDFDQTAGVEVRHGGGSLEAERLVRKLHWYLEERWITERGGGGHELVIERSGELAPVGARSQPSPIDMSAVATRFAPSRHGMGMFLIAVLGVFLGMQLGVGLSMSGREGFNSLLALFTSKTAIYASELLTGVLLKTGTVLVWWALSVVAMLVGGEWLGLELMPDAKLVVDSVLVVGLTVMALLQGSALGCLWERLWEEQPRQTREAAMLIGTIVVLAMASVGYQNTSATLAAVLSVLPGLGPLAVWSHHALGGGAVLALVVLHGLYTIAALRVGAWLFMLDEGPLSYLRRRRRGLGSS